jgi:hypothetical protein
VRGRGPHVGYSGTLLEATDDLSIDV